MPTIPPNIAQKWPDIAPEFPPNGTYTDETALIWSDAGSRAAALYAREARDAVNALSARMDPNAIAEAVISHIAMGGSVNVTAIADAVAKLFGTKLAA